MSKSYNPLAYVADTSQAININGKPFSWKDVDVKMLGSSVPYIQSIEWNGTQEKSYDIGSGTVGKYLGEGNKEFTGSLEIALSEFMKLADAALPISPEGDPLDIPPFTISITYFSRIAPVRYTNLFNVAFTDISNTASQGDTHLYSTLDFIFTSVVNK